MPPGALLLPAEFKSSRKLSKSPESGTKFSTSTAFVLIGLDAGLGSRLKLGEGDGVAETDGAGGGFRDRLENDRSEDVSTLGTVTVSLTLFELWPTTEI